MSKAASVKQRLLNLARKRGEDFNLLLLRYALERFLYRLAQSPHKDCFVLKGAMLFSIWLAGQPLHRATNDLDLLSFGSPDISKLESRFREIVATPVEDDGITFVGTSIRAQAIREDDKYAGVRILLLAHLGQARVPLQVDVGFGDAVFPEPRQEVFPTLLDQAAPRLRAYPKETVVAEKLHAILRLEMTNSRLKDCFDLQFLAENFPFEAPVLTRAISESLNRRDFLFSALKLPPVGLDAEFANDPNKQMQWSAFLKRSALPTISLPGNIQVLQNFLLPILSNLVAGISGPDSWPPRGPWSPNPARQQ